MVYTLNEFTRNVITIIKSIPSGKVMTYGQIAKIAGNPWGSRQVSRILHSMTVKYDLPWHRVVNGKGEISLTGDAKYEQIQKLVDEGIEFKKEKINLNKYLYKFI